MKTLKCENVQASEAIDEIFQVCFETNFDSLKDYFLIQRNFEFEEITGKKIYTESDDDNFTGYNIIGEAQLDRNRFYIKFNNSSKSEIELLFKVSEKNFQKIKRILEIIFIQFDFLKTAITQ